MSARRVEMAGVVLDLTPARVRALRVLHVGPARVSDHSSDEDRTIDWRTVSTLTVYGLAAGGPSRMVWLTDRGLRLADRIAR